MMISKLHITEQGRIQIKLIHSNMNSRRILAKFILAYKLPLFYILLTIYFIFKISTHNDSFSVYAKILYAYIPFIVSFLFTLSFVTLYLDDFKLSDIKVIKYIQIFSFICIALCLMYDIYSVYSIVDTVNLHCYSVKM